MTLELRATCAVRYNARVVIGRSDDAGNRKTLQVNNVRTLY